MRNYVSALQAMSFIEVHHSKPKYQTTQRGIMFLKKWKEMNELMNGEFMSDGPQILTEETPTILPAPRNSYSEHFSTR